MAKDRLLFDNLKRFPDIHLDEEDNFKGYRSCTDVCTSEYLQCATDAFNLLDLFGYVTKPIKMEAMSHVAYMCGEYESDGTALGTVGDLLDRPRDNTLDYHLVWNIRGLHLLHAWMSNLRRLYSPGDDHHPPQSTVDCFNRAYSAALQPYHSWILQKAITTLMSMTMPYKDTLLDLVWEASAEVGSKRDSDVSESDSEVNESETDSNESEPDVNESETDSNESEPDVNESEVGVNECETNANDVMLTSMSGYMENLGIFVHDMIGHLKSRGMWDSYTSGDLAFLSSQEWW